MRFMEMVANFVIRFKMCEKAKDANIIGGSQKNISYTRKTVYDRMLYINIIFLCIYAFLIIFFIHGLITEKYYFTTDINKIKKMGHFLSNFCLYFFRYATFICGYISQDAFT